MPSHSLGPTRCSGTADRRRLALAPLVGGLSWLLVAAPAAAQLAASNGAGVTWGHAAELYRVHIYTSGDPQELRSWYVDLFSMTPRVRGSIPVTADVPGMNVSFSKAEGEVAGTRGRAVDHIDFEVDDLKAFTDYLTERGIDFNLAYREIDSIELAIAFLTDPSGVYIELTEGLDRY